MTLTHHATTTLISILTTLSRRVILGTFLWIIFWPLLWFIRIGEITGPKAWFWIVGELNYPFALIIYLLVDGLLSRFKIRHWLVLAGSVLSVVLFMLFFYSRGGFSFGVLAEAFIF